MNDGQDIGQETDRTPENGPVRAPDEPLVTEEKLLTVAEAARRLRVDPKQIRRYADKLTGQDRTPADVSPLRVRLSAVEALREGAKSEASSEKDIGQDRTQVTDRTEQDSSSGKAESGLLPALVYQHRMGDLEVQIAELRDDKERLYGLLEMAQANLSREQALRSLPAPEPEAIQEMAEAKAEDGGDGAAEKKPGFWHKLFGGA